MDCFYLTGGTALATYYLRHRLSDDLDFFCFEEANNIFLHAFTERIKTEIGAESLRYERLYDRSQYFLLVDQAELKIDSIFLGGELAKAKRIEALPQMIRSVTKEELKTFFGELAKKLLPDILK